MRYSKSTFAPAPDQFLKNKVIFDQSSTGLLSQPRESQKSTKSTHSETMTAENSRSLKMTLIRPILEPFSARYCRQPPENSTRVQNRPLQGSKITPNPPKPCAGLWDFPFSQHIPTIEKIPQRKGVY